jgi:acetyl esterase
MVALDPEVQTLLARMAQASAGKPAPPPMDDAEWAQAGRKAHRGIVALSGDAEAVERVEDRHIPGPAGGAIPIRLYRPRGYAGQGAVVYFHGGGFVSGDLETHDAPLRALANRAAHTVVAVDYRLAPEHAYPAAHDDCFAALAWVSANAAALSIDAGKIAVAGDSAGGTLAIATALRARDRHGPLLAKQILIYPNTDLVAERDYPSIRDCAPRPSWRADMERYFKAYVPAGVDRRQGDLSPLRAQNLSGLPPTLLVTAEADPLRDEGRALAARLAGVGVAVTHREYPGMIHGFLQMAGALMAGKRLIDEVAGFLGKES